MNKASGITYAPRGKTAPVVQPGQFGFAAVALEHGHIFGMCNGLIEAGAQLKWVYDPDPAKVNAFLGRFPGTPVADSEERILGMRAAGPQASTTIMSIALLMDQERGIHDVLKSVHPHPTMSEGIQECLRLLVDKSVYKLRAFPEHLRMWTWRPPDAADGS